MPKGDEPLPEPMVTQRKFMRHIAPLGHSDLLVILFRLWTGPILGMDTYIDQWLHVGWKYLSTSQTQ